MKARRLIAYALALLMITGLLGACAKSGESVKVTIIDGSMSIVTSGTDEMTVEDLLKKAGITLGANDEVTPAPSTVWKSAGADAIRVKRNVTVTVTDGTNEKKVTLSGATVEQAIAQAGFDVKSYAADKDLNAALTEGMVITLKPHEEGFVTTDDKMYYYRDGQMVTNAIVGNEEEGYFYADENGVIDLNYCNGVNIDGQDWNVINGKATLAESESDLTLNRALQAVAQCTNSSMSKQEKLRAAFDYIKTAYLEGVRHDPPYKELDWPIVYANDIFVYGKGDCFSYGAAFAFMGKALGCSDCYACNSGGHGWAEIEGLVYDPEWDMHYPEYNHFAVDYDNNDTDVNYKRGIEPGADYMHVAV